MQTSSLIFYSEKLKYIDLFSKAILYNLINMAQQNYTFKPKNILIDYEDIIEDIKYAFTFNPSDKYQHFRSASRLLNCNKDLSLIFIHKCYEYELIPEISKSGRFHLHGFITITDKNEFYIHALPYLLDKGTLAIVDLKDPLPKKDLQFDSWESYLSKQHEFHKYYEIMTMMKVPLTNH